MNKTAIYAPEKKRQRIRGSRHFSPIDPHAQIKQPSVTGAH